MAFHNLSLLRQHVYFFDFFGRFSSGPKAFTLLGVDDQGDIIQGLRESFNEIQLATHAAKENYTGPIAVAMRFFEPGCTKHFPK